MEASLCRLCVFSVFGARINFDMDASHIFPRCVLVTITLIADVIGVVGFKPVQGMRQDFFSVP